MLALVIFIIILFLYLKWKTRRHSDEPPALPGSLPLIGHGHLLVGNTTRFWEFIRDTSHKCMELGHVAYFLTGPFKFYVLTDPDDIFLLSNTCFQKDEFSYEFTKQLLGNGLLYAPVPIWKRHRKLISPAFNQQILDSFLVIFNKQGRKLVEKMQVEVGRGWFDQSKYVKQNFMETICLTALDDCVTPEEANAYVEAFENYLNGNILRFQTFWLHPDIFFKFSNLKKKLDASIKVLHEMSDKVLKNKRALRKLNETESNTENSPKLKVFMDLLMDLDGGVLTDQEIRDEMNTIIMAGHETSANVIVFALILLGSHPEVQEKLYEEIRRVFGDSDRDIEKQDLSQLIYMEAVLKETMRYFVMAPFVGRHIDREVKLKNCTLKPGNNCLILYYGLHRHPIWGPDVNEFKPERWLDPATLPKNPNAFGGFSIGKRNCIGKTYAMMSMKSTLYYVFRRFKMQADHTKLKFKLDVLLKPITGHYVTIENRS
ncbi:unnamed protein product [Danaus chrysippus]|uniref:(African queen) hypothetical protein n=1 Tax=Danaus chrysippus TaxID=151541 RepID=A0A8J2VTM2_9NEOP|nr:unnamed protein product [Danaus chrysippus]